MKDIKKMILVLALFLVLPLSVHADCQSDFKTIESQFKISYEYNEDTDDFTITLVNPDYTRYSFRRETLEEIDNAQNSINGKILTSITNNYKEDIYKYGIVAMYNECRKIVVKEEMISLKKYNPYADNPLCEGYEEFVLCQKDYDKSIDENEFESRLEAYKKSKETSNSSSNSTAKTEDNAKKEPFFDSILNYIQENTVETVIITVFLIALIISAILFIRSNIKSRRLE